MRAVSSLAALPARLDNLRSVFHRCFVPFQDYPGMTHEQVAIKLFTQMHDALEVTGRPILFSMCNGWDPEVKP